MEWHALARAPRVPKITLFGNKKSCHHFFKALEGLGALSQLDIAGRFKMQNTLHIFADGAFKSEFMQCSSRFSRAWKYRELMKTGANR